MSAAKNKALIRRYIDEGWNKGVVDLLDEIYDPNYTGGSYGGVPELKAALASYRRSFPDLHLTIEDAIAEDEKIAYRWIARGTHRGEWDDIAPTGKPMTVTGITILRIVDGKIVDDRSETNIDTLAEQLQ